VPLGVDPVFNYPPGERSEHLEKMLSDKIKTMPNDLKDTARKAGF
jgi:hypothetical protein